MRRMRDFLRSVRGSDKRLIALCYAAFLALSLLLVLYGAAEDGVRRLTGDVKYMEIAGDREDAFRLRDIVQDGAQFTSLSVDPRMDMNLSLLAPEGGPVYVRRVTVYFDEINMDPGEVCIFYKPKPGMEEYDAIYRVWARKVDENTYAFTLPAGELYGIRLDPGIFSGMAFRLGRIAINEPRSLAERLSVTRPWLLAFAVVPLLAASVLRWLFCARALLAQRKEQRRRGTGR